MEKEAACVGVCFYILWGRLLGLLLVHVASFLFRLSAYIVCTHLTRDTVTTSSGITIFSLC